MLKKAIISVFLPVILASVWVPVAQAESSDWNQVELSEYVASKGDYVMADLKNSTGYLLNDETKTYASFPLLSGQKRKVYYLGRSYFAATPEQTWIVRELAIQSDRITFAKSGEFLRLYDGEKRTSYGIHGHKYFDVMMARENKYVSMGCMLVADDVLDIIQNSFEADEKEMKVITTSDETTLPFYEE